MPQFQVGPTPLSKGSGSRLDSILEAYSDSESHSQEVYEEYLTQDIATEQELFFDDFMKVILDCADWSSKHLAAADQIVEDPKIKKLLEAYRTVSGYETNYYHPFVELANGVLEKHTKKNNQDRTAYCRNDPTFVAGSFGERKPDVITTLKRLILQTRISADARSKKGPEEYPSHWAELIAFVEFKKDNIGVFHPFDVLQAGYLVFETQRHSLRAHHHEHRNILPPDPVCVVHLLILLVLTVDTRHWDIEETIRDRRRL